MIDLRDCRPEQPTDFHAQTGDAKGSIQARMDNKEPIRSEHFSSVWSKYKDLFSEAQHQGKCAWCETRVRGGYSGDVDHFRPKAAVVVYAGLGYRGEDSPPNRQIESRTELGYWWLAYEWENWIFTCSRCNNWKGSQFPTTQPVSQFQPGAESEAQPILINPMDEDPHRHFAWDETGAVSGVSEQGKTTIEVCGLDRRYLERERLREAKKIMSLIHDMAAAINAGNIDELGRHLRRLLEACQADSPYAGMARYLLEQKTGQTYKQCLEMIS